MASYPTVTVKLDVDYENVKRTTDLMSKMIEVIPEGTEYTVDTNMRTGDMCVTIHVAGPVAD